MTVGNVLISSAGRRGELVRIFQSCMSDAGGGRVFTADMSPLSAAGAISDGHFLVPRLTAPTFIDEVLDLCQREGIRHLIPTIDTELPIYAANRDRFQESGVHVWVSGPETVAVARDKERTNAFLSALSLPHVRQWRFDALSVAEPEWPLIGKPRQGSSSVGLMQVRNIDEAASIAGREAYIFEEIARGVEYTVDVLVDSTGQCRLTVPRRRLETRAGEVSKGVAVRHTELMELASQVARALPDAFGVLNVQIFWDEMERVPAIIEINARFGGGFPLAFNAGANAPGWLLAHLAGQQELPSLEWAHHTLMLRYDQGVYRTAREGELP